jgi:hypothetical protein
MVPREQRCDHCFHADAPGGGPEASAMRSCSLSNKVWVMTGCRKEENETLSDPISKSSAAKRESHDEGGTGAAFSATKRSRTRKVLFNLRIELEPLD